MNILNPVSYTHLNGVNIETGAKVAANGSVAMTSIIFIVEAGALSMLLKYGKLNKWVNTAIAIALLIFAVVAVSYTHLRWSMTLKAVKKIRTSEGRMF